MQNSIIINPTVSTNQDNIKHTVIWLHGLGASGDDFVPIVPELNLSVPVRFIFPHAPNLPVTINGGYVMPAWYDIFEIGELSRKVDMVQIDKSTKRIIDIIDQEIQNGTPPQNIVIAGFSQGGAIAYHVAMTLLKQGTILGGLMALSTYFATENEFNTPFDNAKLPIFVGHGIYDDVVSQTFAKDAIDKLASLNLSAIYKRYPMAHQVCAEQIDDIGVWLNGVLKAD